MDSTKCLDIIDETLETLTEMDDISVLGSMTDNELEGLLDDLQTLNSQMEKVLIGEMPLLDSNELQALFDSVTKR